MTVVSGSDEEFLGGTVASVLRALRTAVEAQPAELLYRVPYDVFFEFNSESIVRETVLAVLELPSSPSAHAHGAADVELMAATGQAHAARGAHPAIGLASAEMLFDVALPLILAAIEARSGSDASSTAVAQALHHATWRRFPPGAVAYVEKLMQRLSVAHLEGRRFLSRELHDRVAHDIAAALMRVELMSSAAHQLAGQDGELLASVELILRRTLEDVQDLAVAARNVVGARGFSSALNDLAKADGNLSMPLVLRVEGTPAALAESVAEEGLTVVQEAIRNARRHARNATHIGVLLRWTNRGAEVEVRDDGEGFEQAVIRKNSLGLSGMAERAEAIGADFDIVTNSSGTTVRLVLPIDDGS